MKKKLAMVAVLATMAVSVVGCGKGGAAELYTTQSDFVEAGYEGDCVNTNQKILVLNSDGTYTLENDFLVHQISGVIVADTHTVFKGKYSAGEADADGVKEVTLEAPTDGYVNIKGAVTTVADDKSILDDFSDSTLKVNTTLGTVVVE